MKGRTRAPRVRLTDRGIGIAATGGFLLPAALLSRVGELYVIGAACVLMPLLSVASVRIRAGRAQPEVTVSWRPARPEVGRHMSISASLVERGWRLPQLQMSAPAGLLEQGLAVSDPSPRGRTTKVEWAGIAQRRGRFLVSPIELTVTDGFGAAYASMIAGEARELVVLPRFDPVRRMPGLSPDESTRGSRRSHMRGSEFRALRDYSAGDDARQIHWRASARYGELLVRENEGLAMPRISIVVGKDERGRDQAIEMAASILAGVSAAGWSYTLGTAGSPSELRWTKKSVDRSLVELATFEETLMTTRTKSWRPKGGAVVFVGALSDADERRALMKFAQGAAWKGCVLPREANQEHPFVSDGWQTAVASEEEEIEDAWERLLGRTPWSASRRWR